MQFVRYLIVGAASFFVFAGLSAVPIILPRIPAPIATGFAVTCAGIVNFFGHRHFTFSSARPLIESLPRYTALIAFNSLSGAIVVYGVTTLFGANLIVANAASLVSSTLVSYLLIRKFVI